MNPEKRDINDTISLQFNNVVVMLNRACGMHDLEKMRQTLEHSSVVNDLLDGKCNYAIMDKVELCKIILRTDAADIEDATGVDLVKMMGDNYYNGKKRDKEKQKRYKNSKGSRSKVQR